MDISRTDNYVVRDMSDNVLKRILIDINKSKVHDLEFIPVIVKDDFTIAPPNCVHCSGHPSNGGSGICHCILGGQGMITY